MINAILPAIERMHQQGAVVVIKWDGERASRKLTLLVSRSATGYTYRDDGDSLAQMWGGALNDYMASEGPLGC